MLIFLLLLAFSITMFVVAIKRFKAEKTAARSVPTRTEANKPTTRTITENNWLVDSENAEKILKLVKNDLDESDDYHLSAKELKEDYEGKVYRYEPYELPFKIEGREVFAEVEGEWYRVGRLKKTANLEGTPRLYLYVNEYKYVTEDSIEKEKDDPYFGIECTKVVNL